LAKARSSLAAMQAELKGRGPAADRLRAAKVPAARTDSFFDLATYMERMRELAEKNGVEVRPEASRFGFLQYANEGPETDRIEPVFRQRQVAEHLLEALLTSKPRSLVSVKRERPLTKGEREARLAAETAVFERGRGHRLSVGRQQCRHPTDYRNFPLNQMLRAVSSDHRA